MSFGDKPAPAQTGWPYLRRPFGHDALAQSIATVTELSHGNVHLSIDHFDGFYVVLYWNFRPIIFQETENAGAGQFVVTCSS